MLARSSTLTLPSGDRIDTPLLVPSLSSRGFRFHTDEDTRISEASDFLDLASHALNEALLVSLYDIHYHYINGAEELTDNFLGSILSFPTLLVLDSGGYEAGTNYSADDLYYDPSVAPPWSDERYLETVKALSPDVTGILVSYDRPAPYDEQIGAAQADLLQFRNLVPLLLLKPEPGTSAIDIPRLLPYIGRLAAFGAIGVTEKELGGSTLDRMTTVARLRKALNDAHLNIPIHVFGSLDPLMSPLYFVSGAEIFDGLTWVRYAYHEGAAMYRETPSVLKGDWESPEDVRLGATLLGNLAYLRRLARSMKRFVAGEGDFAVFDEERDGLGDVIRRAESALQSSLREA